MTSDALDGPYGLSALSQTTGSRSFSRHLFPRARTTQDRKSVTGGAACPRCSAVGRVRRRNATARANRPKDSTETNHGRDGWRAGLCGAA
jgi:hypothetical protein